MNTPGGIAQEGSEGEAEDTVGFFDFSVFESADFDLTCCRHQGRSPFAARVEGSVSGNSVIEDLKEAIDKVGPANRATDTLTGAEHVKGP